jgi:hypothetical protein
LNNTAAPNGCQEKNNEFQRLQVLLQERPGLRSPGLSFHDRPFSVPSIRVVSPEPGSGGVGEQAIVSARAGGLTLKPWAAFGLDAPAGLC